MSFLDPHLADRTIDRPTNDSPEITPRADPLDSDQPGHLPAVQDEHPAFCPDLEQLADILAGQTIFEMLHHNAPPWVDTCFTCSARRDQLNQWMDEIGYPDYRVAAREVPAAQRLWRRLSHLPAQELGSHIRLTQEFVFWGFARLLLEQSELEQRSEPQRALVLAHSALSIAMMLDRRTYLPDLIVELQARACLRSSDARRLLGQREASYVELVGARERLMRGGRSALCEARYHELVGALLAEHAAQAIREMAAQALRQAANFYEHAGLEADRGRVELRLGTLYHFEGAWHDAIPHLTQALPSLTDDPACYIHCLLLLANALRASEQEDEATLRLDCAAQVLRSVI